MIYKLDDFSNWEDMKNKVIQADALELLKRLPDNSVDVIVSDPPYNINLKPQRGITKAIKNDNMSNSDFISFLLDFCIEFKRVIKEDTFMFIFCGWSTIPEFRKVFDEEFDLKSMPIWVKNNFGIGYYTRPQYEPCLMYINGKPPVLEKPISDVWKFNRLQAPEHSCQKPVDLIRHILNNFSKEGDTILDPFMGSWTTAKACQELGRDFIGCDLEEDYCRIGERRLAEVPLFQL